MADRRDNNSAGTKLVIRANSTDLGARPISNFWQSPDICQSTGPTQFTQVTPGVPVHLIAMVTNVGTEPALAVRVNFWWANSALGIDKASANPIGDSGVPRTVGVGASVEFPCTRAWIPHALSGQAHPCIVAEAQGVNCPVTASFRADLDSQVGQHNLTFAPATAQQTLTLMLFNLFSETAETVVYASTMRLSGEHVRELAPQVLLDARLPERRVALRAAGVMVEDLDTHDFLRLVEVKRGKQPERDERQSHLSEPRGFRGDDLAGSGLVEILLSPGGSAELVFESRGTRIGGHEMLIHQISQLSNGFIVGGYTLVQPG
jgi:hypothetical protein